jgi:hypothetical protein
MAYYRPAGQVFLFAQPVPELEPYQVSGEEPSAVMRLAVPVSLTLSCRTIGWVGGEQCEVETWSAAPGFLLKVAGGSDFYISQGGDSIVQMDHAGNAPAALVRLNREILLGPALVLALALRGTWCLHASAVIFKEKLIVFLGESGQGKSTLAAYLTASKDVDWRLVADDILPVTMSSGRVDAWPQFPQLKLSMEAQPGPGLPEILPINRICVLMYADSDEMPELQLIPPSQSIQILLGHTAGTRLFEPALLAEHLTFCARVAEQIPVYKLGYPHRKDTLPKVRELLENLC